MGCGTSKNLGPNTMGYTSQNIAQPQTLANMHAQVIPKPVCESSSSPQPAPAPAPAAASLAEMKKEAPKSKAASLEGYGEHAFWGAVAQPYLVKQGLPADTLSNPAWVKDPPTTDKVAAAVLDWAVSHGASTFCHWFQPMCAIGRHGQSGGVQLGMFTFDKENKTHWDFKGKDLLRGETDGSSFPNGGLRATHTAGGYLTLDPTSQIWLRGDSIFLPACFVAYTGKALDEKTPLLRSEQAMSREGQRLFKLLGHNISGLLTNIGLEQEFFFVPDSAYQKRPDLQFCGRTLLGKSPALGQEGSTHYMAPINTQKASLACMQEIQTECFKVGVPLQTRHREVAPNQYEFAPLFGPVQQQVDQNLCAMQIMEEVAPKHGLRTLLNEKPFQGVNGSGKHNNWSIATKCGAQLLNPGDLAKKMGDLKLFPIIMSALVSGVDIYGDLMRMAIASPGNDFRLGAMEAPPAVISMYLGEDMTTYLHKFMNGDVHEYIPTTSQIDLGVSYLPKIMAPAEDRNRTSPFPYGGHRFEFRAVGSSQNVSLVNTVLAAITAKQFKVISDRIEAGEDGVAIAQSLLKKHMKSVFNGNGYDPGWPVKARSNGLWVIESGVDAIKMFSDDKNVELFSSLNIFSREEVLARQTCLLSQYTLTVETEAKTMIDMIKQHVIPSCKAAKIDETPCANAVGELQSALKQIGEAEVAEAATLCRVLRLETMMKLRKQIDEIEGMIPASLWTLATYKELLFIDQHT